MLFGCPWGARKTLNDYYCNFPWVKAPIDWTKAAEEKKFKASSSSSAEQNTLTIV